VHPTSCACAERVQKPFEGGDRAILKILMVRSCLLLLFTLLLSAGLEGQALPSPLPTPPADPSQATQAQPADARERDSEIKRQEETGTSNDRLFYALPNFLTVEAKNVPPLTVGEKFKVVTRGSFDYIQTPWYAFLAGVSQAQNSEAGYGQRAAGYGKRFGAAFADGTIENYMTGAILPSILHEDPRYYQLGGGSFWHRTGYATSRIPVTRTDSGQAQLNYSEIVGSALSAVISTYGYHPSADRNLSNACKAWGTQMGYDTLTLFIKEYWPDIRRKLQKKNGPQR
jgi:hypothetical protein